MPVLLQPFVWAAGVTVYQIIYAHISTETIAAVNIASSIERIGFIFFAGMAHAAGIMIGNEIGSNNDETACHNGKRFL
jgi:Na+-driven multidrug efflux pump